MIYADTKELRMLARVFNSGGRSLGPIFAGTLNNLAFLARDKSLANLRNGLVIRNPAFVKSRVRVEKAQPTRLASVTGSLPIARSGKQGAFTGWKEQEGADSEKARTTLLIARAGGVKEGRQIQNTRLKPGAYDELPSDGTYGEWLREHSEGPGFMKPWIVRKKTGAMTPGVYRFSGAKRIIFINGKRFIRRPIVRVQKVLSAPVRIRRLPWAQDAMKKSLTDKRVFVEYLKSVRHALSKMK